MRVRVFALVLAVSSLLGCKTLSEVSIGYADAVTTSSLPGEGPWARVSVAFPGLTDLDPLSSPSLTRYAVTPEEVESVKLTSVELEGPAGACGMPFSAIELQLVAAELGPVTLATATRSGECLSWTLAGETEFGPWFRQPKISIIALVDGQPTSRTEGPERSEGVGARAGEAEHDPSPARRREESEPADPQSLSLQVSFLVDVADKRID